MISAANAANNPGEMATKKRKRHKIGVLVPFVPFCGNYHGTLGNGAPPLCYELTAMGKARQHHYVPIFYLKGFTLSGRDDDALHVCDQRRLDRWPWASTPVGAAHERDMYAVETKDGTDPELVETALCKLEGELAPILHETIRQQMLPAGAELNTLLNFLTLMGLRIPRTRDRLGQFAGSLTKRGVRAYYAQLENWNSLQRDAEANGRPIRITHQEFLDAFDSDDYTIEWGNNFFVRAMFESSDVLLRLLSERKWSLITLADGTPDFVCSDYPLAPDWLKPRAGPLGPSFMARGTQITFPLARRLAMIGVHGGQSTMRIYGTRQVARTNRSTIMYAYQVYSPSADFVWRMDNGQVGNAADRLKWLKERARIQDRTANFRQEQRTEGD